MKHIDIYMTAHNRWVIVKHYNFSEIDGICTRFGDSQYIGIRSGMNETDDRETIAHELAHLEDGTENVMHVIAGKRAEKWKRELLIPYDNLREAMEEYGEHGIGFLATFFGVKYETMERRIKEAFNI